LLKPESNQRAQAVAGKSGSIALHPECIELTDVAIREWTGSEQAQMNSQLLKDTVKLLFADNKVCLRWMRAQDL